VTVETVETSRPAPVAPPGLGRVDLGLYATIVWVWGTSWIALHHQLGVVAPEVSLVWRFALSFVLMLAWMLWRGDRIAASLADHGRYAALGALMFSTNLLLFYYGGLSVPSGLLAVVFSLASVFNLLLGAIIFRQRADPRVALGGVLGVAGVAGMFWPEIVGKDFDRAALVGLGLCIAGTVLFCLGNMVATASQRRGLPMTSATLWAMAYGTLFLTLFSVARGSAFIIETTPAYLGGLVYLAVASSVIAYAAYMRLLQRIGAARASYSTVLFPVVALAISTFAEGYRWTIPSLIGLALVVAGNLFVHGPRRELGHKV
jgi:drug/metabolite transporter (DMT)-like permease